MKKIELFLIFVRMAEIISSEKNKTETESDENKPKSIQDENRNSSILNQI